MCTIKMRLIFLIIVLTKFSLFANVGEIVLTCKMNYGISGENDEADIEFKNLSIIDQDQVFYLNLEEKWLSVESKKDIDEGKIKYSKNDFALSDSTIFSMSYYENNGRLIRKNTIELNRYTGFVKHEFNTFNETIYRTGRCIANKKKKLF